MDKGDFPGQGTRMKAPQEYRLESSRGISMLTPGSRGPKSVNDACMREGTVWSNNVGTVGLRYPEQGKHPYPYLKASHIISLCLVTIP